MPAWWANDFEGSAANQGDVFTVHFGETFVNFEVTALEPGKKVEWLVTDCYLPWLKDKTEWNGTKMSFEISSKGNETEIKATHIGLTPEVECYDSCKKGWDFYIKDSLYKLFTEGVGRPQTPQAAR